MYSLISFQKIKIHFELFKYLFHLKKVSKSLVGKKYFLKTSSFVKEVSNGILEKTPFTEETIPFIQKLKYPFFSGHILK